MDNKIIVSHSSFGIGYVFENEINNQTIDFYYKDKKTTINNKIGLDFNPFFTIPSPSAIDEILNNTYENNYNINDGELSSLKNYNNGNQLKIFFKSPSNINATIYEKDNSYKASYNFIRHYGTCTCSTRVNCIHSYFLLKQANNYIESLLSDEIIDENIKELILKMTYSNYTSRYFFDFQIIKDFKEKIIDNISLSLLEMINKICKNDSKKCYYAVSKFLSFVFDKKANVFNEFINNNLNSKSLFVENLCTFINNKYYEKPENIEETSDLIYYYYFTNQANKAFQYFEKLGYNVNYIKGYLEKSIPLNDEESHSLTNLIVDNRWYISINPIDDLLIEKLKKDDLLILMKIFKSNFKNYYKTLSFSDKINCLSVFNETDVSEILNEFNDNVKTNDDLINYLSILFEYAYFNYNKKSDLIIDFLFKYKISMYLLPFYFLKNISISQKKLLYKKYNSIYSKEKILLKEFDELFTYSYSYEYSTFSYHNYTIYINFYLKSSNKRIIRDRMSNDKFYSILNHNYSFKNNIFPNLLIDIMDLTSNDYLALDEKINEEIKERDYQNKISEFVNDTLKLNDYDISLINNSFHSSINADLNIYFHNNKAIDLKILLNNKEYIVKDIYSFIDNFEYNRLVKFGKANEFCCNTNNLNNHGKEIFNILNKINFDNKSDYSKNVYMNEVTFMDYYNNNDYINFEYKKYYFDKNEAEIEYVIDENYQIKTIPSIDLNKTMLFNSYLIYFDNTNNLSKKYNLKNYNLFIFFNKFYDLKINENDAIFNSFMENVYSTNKDNITLKINYEEVKKYTSTRIDLYFDFEDSEIVLKREYYVDNKLITNPLLNSQLNNKVKMIDNFLVTLGFDEDKIASDDKIASFLSADLSLLNKLANVYISDSIKNRKIMDFPKLKYRIDYNNNMMDVFLDDSTFSDEELDKIIRAIKKKKSYIKLKDNVILNINNSEAKDFYDVTTDLHLDSKNLKETKSMPIYNRFKLINYKDDYPLDKYMEEVISSISSFKNKNLELPTYDYELKQYQKEAISWLSELKKYNFSGILADDMGLGKTFEMLAFYDLDKENEPSLVVCPKSLVFNWASEINKFINHTEYVKIYGSAEDRKKIINDILPNKRCLYITSYDSLRNDIELYKNIKFRYVILDEAQAIKTFTAKKAISTKLLNSTYRFVLTGTPIENNVLELWSIFDFLMPGFFEDIKEFKSRFENEEGYKEVVAKKISMFILRRTKKETLKELPDKYERLLTTELTSEQQLIYDAHCKMAKDILLTQDNAFAVLPYLLRLRQICVDPHMFIDNYQGKSAKMELLNSLLDEYVPNKRKILIFSQFVEMLKLIEKDLVSKNIKYYMLTGATKAEDRIKMCNEFNKEDCQIQVFLISIKAGGSGLNLIGADTVIHMDIWWNLAVENQATDRTYRIGQTKNVEVIKIMCEHTIEEKVIELQNKKKDLIDSLISNDDKSITSMSKNDIKFLLN